MANTAKLVSMKDDDLTNYMVKERVAIVSLNNPPVNGLSFDLRSSLAHQLVRATNDSSVDAVVILGNNHVFCGGADIKQLDTPQYWAWPRTIEIAQMIDEMNKPVVAVIEKLALGGGLELALGCHYRLAQASSQMGQPEIKLGLFPGGGAILRLPRLIGVEAALSLMLTGQFIGAKQALQLGLIDHIVDDDLVQTAIEFIKLKLKEGGAPRRARDIPLARANISELFEKFRNAHSLPGMGIAAKVILDCTQVAVSNSFESGLKASDEGTALLMKSEESKALRYLFFAERQASKLVAPTSTSNQTLTTADISPSLVIKGEEDLELLKNLQSSGYRLHDENQPIPPDHILLHVYPKSRLIEIVQKSIINSEYLIKLTRTLKSFNRIVIFSNSGSNFESIGFSLLLAFHEISKLFLPHSFNQLLANFGINSGPLRLSIDSDQNELKQPSNETLEICFSAMYKEGLKMIRNGRVINISDIDVAAIYAFNVPAIYGGPMYQNQLKNTC